MGGEIKPSNLKKKNQIFAAETKTFHIKIWGSPFGGVESRFEERIKHRHGGVIAEFSVQWFLWNKFVRDDDDDDDDDEDRRL